MGTNVRQNIVTNGLVLYLDAGNRMSYTSGSTTWSDLSGFQRNTSLINTPTWNSQGYFTFNGTSNYISGSATTFGLDGNVGFSLQSTVMILDSTKRNPIIVNQVGPNYQGFSIELGTAAGFWTNTIRVSLVGSPSNTSFDARYGTNLITNNQIYVVSAVVDYTNKTVDVYLNGVLQTKTSFSTPTTPNNWNVNQQFFLGAQPSDSIYGNMRYYNLMMYKTLLSPQEINQNYNALKTRYGLI